MQKLLYAYWSGSQRPDATRQRFLTEIAPRLRELGVERLQFNATDLGDLSGALEHLKLSTMSPKPDGIVSFWLSSTWRREPAERLLAETFTRIAGFAVAESTVLQNDVHRPDASGRTYGFSQVSFLHVPPRLSPDEWRDRWLNRHSRIAVETQSNFRYVQNFVAYPLTPDAPPWKGIVEESFPPEALRNLRVFYDAENDEEKFQHNFQAMMQSCAAFIDADGIDVLATSEYQLHSEPEPRL
jgi:hypothetical protein